MFENIICCVCETFGISRRKSCIINCILMLVLSIPCVLGFNLLSGITPLGAGSNIMDFEDFLVSNILLPLGAAVFVLFCTTRYGWGWKNFFNEVNTGKGLKLPAFMRKYMTFVLPVIIFAIFVIGIVNIFA